MNVALIFGITLIFLFVLAFTTRRRFGVLGLALAAGAMLSDLWADKLTPIFVDAGVQISQPPMITVVSVLLVLLPAAVLFFSGPSYKDMAMRLGGAFCFAALAAALLIQPIGTGLVLTGQSLEVYNFFVTNQVYIVTAGLIIAILDILTTKTPRYSRGKH